MQSPCGWHVCPLQEGSRNWAEESPTGEEAEGKLKADTVRLFEGALNLLLAGRICWRVWEGGQILIGDSGVQHHRWRWQTRARRPGGLEDSCLQSTALQALLLGIQCSWVL